MKSIQYRNQKYRLSAMLEGEILFKGLISTQEKNTLMQSKIPKGQKDDTCFAHQ